MNRIFEVKPFRGVCLHSDSVEGCVRDIVDAAESRRGLRMTFVNPHSYNILSASPDLGLLQDLRSMDKVFADGIGVVWMHRLLNDSRIECLRFDILADDLFRECARLDVPIFILGGRDGVAQSAAAKIVRDFGTPVVGAHHGYLPPDTSNVEKISGLIAAAGAQVVCIGTGAPLQERWVVALAASLPTTTFITCGGYLDQALWDKTYFPQWAYRWRVSWVVRLYREPKRLWRRYLLGIPKFLGNCAIWYLSGRPDPP